MTRNGSSPTSVSLPACIFSGVTVPEKQNEVSGLMIMGIVGGAIFPPVMGFMSDQFGQAGAILILALGAMYLFTYIRVIKD